MSRSGQGSSLDKGMSMQVNWELECRATVSQNIELQKMLHELCVENRKLRERIDVMQREINGWQGECEYLQAEQQNLIDINADLTKEVHFCHQQMGWSSVPASESDTDGCSPTGWAAELESE